MLRRWAEDNVPAILDARDAYDEAQDAAALDWEPDGPGRSAGT